MAYLEHCEERCNRGITTPAYVVLHYHYMVAGFHTSLLVVSSVLSEGSIAHCSHKLRESEVAFVILV
eukprot:2464910-Amphidinium_carterae.2